MTNYSLPVKYSLYCFLFLSSIHLFGQALNSPESIDYHAASQRYFISNDGSGEILALDTLGALSIIDEGLDGTGPLALEVVGDILYANTGPNIHYYDLIDNTLTGTIEIDGAVALNGMTSNGTDVLYVTDLSTQKIHSITLPGFEVNTLAETAFSPNGIIYDEANMRLVVVGLGIGDGIHQFDLESQELSLLVEPDFFLLDGITMDRCGSFYVSSWSNSSIVQYNNDFSESSVLLTNVSTPADLYFNLKEDLLAIPSFSSDSLIFYPINAAQISNVEVGPCLFDHITALSFNEVTFTVTWNESDTEWELDYGGFAAFPADSTGQRFFSETIPATGEEVTIFLTDENGIACGDESTFQTNEECPWALGIEEVNPKSFQLNPTIIDAKESLFIQSKDLQNHFVLYSIQGQQISTFTIVQEGAINLAPLHLNSGIYLIRDIESGQIGRFVVK